MVKRLEEAFPLGDKELDGMDLYRRITKEDCTSEGGIAVSSGCIACNTGGDCRAGIYRTVKYEVSED